MLRLHPDGTLDTTFRAEGFGGVAPLAVQSDGKVLITGEFAMLARLNPDGQLDKTFSPWPNSIVNPHAPWETPGLGGIALQPDGKMVIFERNLGPFRLGS